MKLTNTYSTFRITCLLATLYVAAAGSLFAQLPNQASMVMANDNRHPAGIPANGVLGVRLFARQGQWRPEESDGPTLDVAAFGEESGSLVIPSPLLRAVEGSDIIVHVENGLPERLDIHGFVTRPASSDAVFSIPAGEAREIRFSAGAPGTYHYWATTAGSTLNNRRALESQLGGAFIVDARGNAAADRVFVLTQWDDTGRIADEVVNPEVRRVFTINGLSWPHTERLDERVGQAARWHIVNLTRTAHPLHLHGFYFTVQAVGTGFRTNIYEPGEYRQVVTEVLTVGATMQMTWTPDRAGNWLLHCHLIAHITPALRFWAPTPPPPGDHAEHDAHDATTSMAGLVMGIRVTGDGTAKAPQSISGAERQMTLVMHRLPKHWHPEDAYGFALKSGDRDSGPEEATVPGPLLVLTRNEPVVITLKNELPEATAIHWHGIELESYYDGVPGWSGTSSSTTPAIEPGGTFTVRFTPPRAGTFMYHTHSHDNRQLASGLYGAIVVLEPGETFDPLRDHVVVLGMEGTKDTQKYERFPVIINGSRDAAPTVKSGVTNRFRFINITSNFGGLNVSLISANEPIPWLPIAKDGANLPANQQIVRPAFRQQISVGETFDFEVEPPPAGVLWLDLRRASGEWVQQVRMPIVR